MTSSMYVDFKKGTRVEVDTILGDLLERGVRLGLKTPILEAAFVKRCRSIKGDWHDLVRASAHGFRPHHLLHFNPHSSRTLPPPRDPDSRPPLGPCPRWPEFPGSAPQSNPSAAAHSRKVVDVPAWNCRCSLFHAVLLFRRLPGQHRRLSPRHAPETAICIALHTSASTAIPT